MTRYTKAQTIGQSCHHPNAVHTRKPHQRGITNICSTFLIYHTLHILTCMLAYRTLALPYLVVVIVQSMCDSDTSRAAVFNGLAWRRRAAKEGSAEVDVV
jgi:hypothetical protein